MDVLGEHDGILPLGAPLDERFKGALQVADGYLLLHQLPENFRSTLRRRQTGDLADRTGGVFLRFVEQILGFLHTEERRDVPGEQQRKVVDEDARIVHDADAHALQRHGLGLEGLEGLDAGQKPFTELEFHARHGQVFVGIAGEDHVSFEFPP